MAQVKEATNGETATSLYVGDLHDDVNEQSLWTVFSKFGHVISVRLCRDAHTNKSLNYAYINYGSVEDAKEALKSANFYEIYGLPCRVMPSMRDSNQRKLNIGNLFIKNIHPDVDSKILFDAFSNFGPILSCKVAVNEYGVSKGYGFIQFEKQEDAEFAKSMSNGLDFEGRYMIVANFVPKSQRKNAKTVNPEDYTNIFVRNYPKEWEEKEIRNVFEKFGDITSIFVGKNENGENLGYAFINFATASSAKKAVEEMNDTEISEGVRWLISRAQKKAERRAHLRRQFNIRKKEFAKATQNRNLYIKNFDENMTDEKFLNLFKPFGKIESYELVKDDKDKPRGFGFVCFETVEQATAAIEKLSGKVIESKPLFVALAQTKEERKKMLDQKAYNTSIRPPVFNGPGPMHFMYSNPPGPVPAMPYSGPSYPRYHPVGPIRGQQRMAQPITPGMIASQQYQQQNFRGNNYFQGYNGPSHPRPRANSSYSNNRHQGNYQNRPYQSNQPHMPSTNQNPIETQRTVRPHAEKVVPVKTPRGVELKEEFKEKIYTMTQKISQEKGFPSDRVAMIAGVIIEFYLSKSLNVSNLKDSEIEFTIINAFQSYSPPDSSDNQF